VDALYPPVEERPQQLQLPGEVLRVGRAPQGGGGALVGSRRAAEAEVHPARVQGLEHAELLGDHERCVVGQHDTAGADADVSRGRGGGTDENGRGAARVAGHAVVLGDPVPVVAQLVGQLRQGDAVLQRLPARAAGGDGGQVEHG